jgi:hypothetical protein
MNVAFCTHTRSCRTWGLVFGSMTKGMHGQSPARAASLPTNRSASLSPAAAQQLQRSIERARRKSILETQEGKRPAFSIPAVASLSPEVCKVSAL